MKDRPPPAPPADATPTVKISEGSVSASVTAPDAAAAAVVCRTVPRGRRNRQGHRRWTIFGSQIEKVVVALETAGYVVERRVYSTPDATSASRP